MLTAESRQLGALSQWVADSAHDDLVDSLLEQFQIILVKFLVAHEAEHLTIDDLLSLQLAPVLLREFCEQHILDVVLVGHAATYRA